jgi:plasmid stability protein
MGKTASLTVRIPDALKRRIEAKAALEHRSLSAQVEHELSEALRDTRVPGPVKAGKLLGRFAGRKVPSDEDFRLARRMLWARLDLD